PVVPSLDDFAESLNRVNEVGPRMRLRMARKLESFRPVFLHSTSQRARIVLSPLRQAAARNLLARSDRVRYSRRKTCLRKTCLRKPSLTHVAAIPHVQCCTQSACRDGMML